MTDFTDIMGRIAANYAAEPRQAHEFTAEHYAATQGISVRAAREQLKRAEDDGMIVSRMAVDQGHRLRLYREAAP